METPPPTSDPAEQGPPQTVETASPPSPPVSPAGPSIKPKAPAQTVPSPRLDERKHWEVIKAFVAATESNGGPASAEDAAQVMGMKESSIGVVLAFFTDVGILIRAAGGGKYDVASQAKEYVQALGWGDVNAGHKFKPLYADKWFTRALVPRLRMRPHSMDESCAILADAAGGASKEYKLSFERLLRQMDFVGLCKVEGNQVSLANSDLEGGNGRSDPSPATTMVTPQGLPQVSTGGAIPEHANFLFLDKARTRKFVVLPPEGPAIKKKELERIKAWLDVLFSDQFDEEDDDPTQ